MWGSISLLQVHFSNNDFLGVRISFFWHWGYTKGKGRVICRSEVLEKWSLEKWGTTLCGLWPHRISDVLARV